MRDQILTVLASVLAVIAIGAPLVAFGFGVRARRITIAAAARAQAATPETTSGSVLRPYSVYLNGLKCNEAIEARFQLSAVSDTVLEFTQFVTAGSPTAGILLAALRTQEQLRASVGPIGGAELYLGKLRVAHLDCFVNHRLGVTKLKAKLIGQVEPSEAAT